jgi:hypothetical protein
LVEKALNQIIEDFIFHADKIVEARLSFAQKIHFARSISLDEHDNSMWNLVTALRNDFAHEFDPKTGASLGARIDMRATCAHYDRSLQTSFIHFSEAVFYPGDLLTS